MRLRGGAGLQSKGGGNIITLLFTLRAHTQSGVFDLPETLLCPEGQARVFESTGSRNLDYLLRRRRRAASCGLSVVLLDDPAKLLLAADGTFGLRLEGLVEDFVVHADASVWAPGIVMCYPGSDNIV